MEIEGLKEGEDDGIEDDGLSEMDGFSEGDTVGLKVEDSELARR